MRILGTLTGLQQEMVSTAQCWRPRRSSGSAPEGLMGVVSFTTTEAASFMTGQALVVDGGIARL
ncbi:hypothetical protein [Streptomyces sp. NPDC048295]|uniref:hypothetical protein n=1 Tax=Streptomyces sp. NPDC048295 TaxID=3154617 RepID=UPI0034185D08